MESSRQTRAFYENGERRFPAALDTWAFAWGGAADSERSDLEILAGRTQKRTLAEQRALIRPYVHIFKPTSGTPPYPAVIQFHGCTGYRAGFMKRWAELANEEGFIVLAVDSNRARGISYKKSLSSVCGGKALIGQQRAGDVAAALEIARARKNIDSSRIVVSGWSHGAWSVMDYIALSSANKSSVSIKGDASTVRPVGAALFYPYCGPGSWSRHEHWYGYGRTIAFIAGRDRIVSGPECKAQFESISAAGNSVEIAYYPEADHSFDDPGPDGVKKAYTESRPAVADAAARYRAFLRDIKSPR
ncbi:MAG: dienelactone hydrolase family protein [Parvularculaceae bacterium]